MRASAAPANKGHFPTLNVQPKAKRIAQNLPVRRSELGRLEYSIPEVYSAIAYVVI
jgi:hypothetical protein